MGNGNLPEDGALDKRSWVELLRSAGFSEAEMHAWHCEFERRSPEQHLRFLQRLSIPKDEIDMIRAYAAGPQRIKNILESSENYMKYLYELFEGLDRLGPGSPENTARALAAVPDLPEKPRILDIGCGTGAQTMDLARITAGEILAVDNHQPYLDRLLERARESGCADRVRTRIADMRRLDADLGLVPGNFDLLWSEGALYIMASPRRSRPCVGISCPANACASRNASGSRTSQVRTCANSGPKAIPEYATWRAAWSWPAPRAGPCWTTFSSASNAGAISTARWRTGRRNSRTFTRTKPTPASWWKPPCGKSSSSRPIPAPGTISSWFCKNRRRS
ncbi:MAG: MerR family transcriptional regulator [Desulfovibrionaceae bacterium]